MGLFIIEIHDDKLINGMRDIDYLSLDGRSLRTLLTVLEESSVSAAAERLGLSQSAVSHTLDKLRLALGDPLFVRSGRGIAPTARAQALRDPVRALLDDLKRLTDERVFDPAIGRLEFTVAANDFQRDLVFPHVVRGMLEDRLDVHLHFVASGMPATNLLHEARCQLIVTPFPPAGEDIYQARLFEDRLVCFYDGSQREAPDCLETLQRADHIDVRFDEGRASVGSRRELDEVLQRNPRVTVANFAAIAAFLRDTALVAVQPSLMGKLGLREFDTAELPCGAEPLVFYMVWHKRDHHDPAHRWLRERVKAGAARALV